MPKRFVAETSRGRNVLAPSCYPTLLIIIALSHRKSMSEVLSRRLSYVTQYWLLLIHRTSPLRSRRHCLKAILDFFFSSILLKLSAEMENNSNKLVLPIFFTILFNSLGLFSVKLMHVFLVWRLVSMEAMVTRPEGMFVTVKILLLT